MRQYAGEEDYSAVRGFLREVMLANGLRELSWHVARLDYWRWHGSMNCGDLGVKNIHIWEKNGEIISVLNPEGKCHAFIQMHPDHCCSDLYGEMLAVAENKLADMGMDGKRKVIVWSDSGDLGSHEVLLQRGYSKIDRPEVKEVQNRRDLDADVPDVSVPEGYTVRNMAVMDDLPSRSWCSFKAFHPQDPEENYNGWAWYRNIRAAPLYNMELDIVAIDENREIVSFCTVWYDNVTRTAYFEPVGTHPDYQRKGLGKACLTEGLRRLKKLGCKRAFVSGHSVPAIGLYKSAGFLENDVSESWEKFL
ncbi:MAG: GNAT family N-acetyltransferase [Candidatus Thermoplasmatota archaeon]|nr:GNAT family N-acetyltransferase [Euryarchaeota archaeon]MBU4071885.1 GNAT family N-acetyltransferase [Candidatus Thermoplasmatota archaeon]MBU4144386.1 GNAT family N-acetyltransferase [Candidatus Thermoplasmatota archaeon]MBU4591319.1 GNAT family N-acetyltransferase [Candidatus Thermoplasmatota archaeon]